MPTNVDITTNPAIGEVAEQLKLDFTELFNMTQDIGVDFDEAFYQRNYLLMVLVVCSIQLLLQIVVTIKY